MREFGFAFMMLGLLGGWTSANEGVWVDGHELKSVGDHKNVGTIFYYPQHHRLFDERFSEYVDSDFCLQVSESQFRILQQLERSGCLAVFTEGHLRQMVHDDVSETDLRTVLFYFDDGVPEQVSSLQREILYEYGAAFVYLCLNPSVTLYPTITMEDFVRIDGMVQDALGRGQPLPQIAYERREILAMEEIRAYLQERPGYQVALIYGHLHQFHRHVGGDFQPKFLVYQDSRLF